MDMKALFAVLLVSLALFAGAAWAQYDDSGYGDDYYYDTGYSSGCCCVPMFALVGGAAAFTYAYKKE
jgi:cytochrome bd-type quinol oxidase subunit 2